MEALSLLPISVPEDGLEAGLLLFEEETEQLVLGDNRVAISPDGLRLVNRSLIDCMMNIHAEPSIGDASNTPRLFARYRQISVQSCDDSISLPGPEILRCVRIDAGKGRLCFRHATKQLFVLRNALSGEEIPIEFAEPIYEVIVLEELDTENCFIIALTATRFPRGYYGPRSSVISGNLVLLKIDLDLAETKAKFESEDNHEVEEAPENNVSGQMCEERIITTSSRYAVSEKIDDSAMIEILFQRYLGELDGQCRPVILEEITRLLAVLKK